MSRINGFGGWLADPHVAASGAAPMVEVMAGTSLPVPRTPGQPAPDRPCPGVGEHTDAVLREFGLD